MRQLNVLRETIVCNNGISKNNKFVRQCTKSSNQIQNKNFIEINDALRGTYNFNSKIEFKTSILKSILCDSSDADILVSGTITIAGSGVDDVAKRLDQRNKGVIFRNCNHSMTPQVK